MTVSIEVLTTVISFAGLLAALAAGFGWMIHRMDAQSQRLDAKIDDLHRELVEVKISVARIEGPLPRIIPAR